LIDPPHRRATLIAQAEQDSYRFDIHLQGQSETVFLDV
jgi:protocatechuate 3,4-dioxygenase alpha subunit